MTKIASEETWDAVVVGAGLAGLVCAKHLSQAGFSCRLFEASDAVGGRVRTDVVDGFRLDRGFQVFLPAYPEAQRELNYKRLELQSFEPGAKIWHDGRFHRLSDPWRRPQHALSVALTSIVPFADKLRVAKFRRDTARGSLESIYARPERSTAKLLQERGFSQHMIDRFFRPFLGGVFLDRQLQTSSRMCEFVFRMFSAGDASVPRLGMEEIPRQIAAALPANTVRLASPVEGIDGREVKLRDGDCIRARAIVVATDGPTAKDLLQADVRTEGQSVTCLYYAGQSPPTREAILLLNGEDGPINNLCVPSNVSSAYAPPGRCLISATVVGELQDESNLEQLVREQLVSWFGEEANIYEHLRTYRIPYALPNQAPPRLDPVEKPPEVRPGLFRCGDYCDTASINGAMASGRRAAEAVTAAFAASS